MSNKTIKVTRRILGVVLSVTSVVCALALMIACVCISLEGEHPFTPQSVKEAWNVTAIFVCLFLASAIAAGLWHVLFPTPSVKQRGLVFPELGLAKVKARLARKQYPDELLLPLFKQEKYVGSLRISAVVICLLCTIYSLCYLHNPDRFTSVGEQLNEQVLAAVIPVLCAAALALIYCLTVRILTDISCERAAVYAKSIMLLPAPSAPKRPMGKQKKELPKYAMIVARTALLITAVILIVFGIFNGGMQDVLQKAIKICTECIGLG